MKYQRPAFSVSLILGICLGGIILAQEKNHDKKKIVLTLKGCLAGALANNLDLTIEAMNPVIDDALIAGTKEQYLPQFGLSYFNQNQTILGGWGVEGTSYPFKMDNTSFNLTQKVAMGGSATLSFTNSMTNTGRAFQVINPSYNSSFQLSLTQPLLKGFGPGVNRFPTTQAIFQRHGAISGLKSRLIQTVFDVEDAYWNLYFAIESMKVQENALEQSRAILKRNQEGVRIGAKFAIDVLSSEAEVAQDEDALVSVRQTAEQAEIRLKKLLNLPSDSPGSVPSLVPADTPVYETKEVAYDEALKIAFAERPEMAQSDKELENSAYSVRYWRNQLLPELSLTFATWSPGQSGIKHLYDTNNPFTGQIIGKITGSRMEALNEALKRTYKNWSVNVNLNVSFANFFTRSSLAKSKVEQEQIKVRLEKQKQTIGYEVAGAIQFLRNAEKKIKSSAASRELQEKRLAAEMQRIQLGRGTIEWQVSYQRQLTNARTSELRAGIDYKLAVANLERVMGTNLKAKGLKFRDFEF